MDYKFKQPIHGTIGTTKYQCTIEWRNGKIIADEPVTSGGQDAGPDPSTLLASSLAACTLITLRMYIDRKGWDIPNFAVNVNFYQVTQNEKLTTTIDRDIVFLSPVPEEQKTRLVEIAKICPVSKILESDIRLRTFVFRDAETKVIRYANDEITVEWKPEFCQHSGRCFTQLPSVFDPKVRKWINPNGASSKEIIEQVEKCPSGALRYFYNEGNGNK